MKANTLQSIMDTGLQLLQERGYNAFSYADIAEVIGIRKASIHYHFPSKQDLVMAVLIQYRKDFLAALQQIGSSADRPIQKLKRYYGMYRAPLEDSAKLCLCSMMAAEINTFPQEIRDEINYFFYCNEQWLLEILKAGQQEKNLHITISLQEQARILVAFAQGIQLLARSLGDLAHFDRSVTHLLAPLTHSPGSV